eukprot:CAMPEP_0113471460 /NCGR_PEP_ID=MMETSP0014_2-20120614/16987_1 /TAXON_ID=2857 /ORGANISM="Nitzschia sp." /LENGTH=76 /DNA_ID=CAMNT_0000364091 /DNA_START=266 /DNA_END=496 /DNA_ORIENTATION=- /assembly_acc=CAM_ASM_000159
MGNTNPIAAMAGKNQAAEKQEQLSDGINTLTGANKTADQLAQEERAKDRVAEYEQKKRDREERKKKLTEQWAANKK